MKDEKQIEKDFIEFLIEEQKYTYRSDIKDRATLECNFRKHFERLNQVNLSDSEFSRLKENIINSNVYESAKILREINTLRRDDDTPLQYTLVNINDWCKNEFEVINQLRINTENSNHRYDVIILINGLPLVQIELKTLHITPKKAMEQIINYKNDAGNGYTNSLLCFMQLFIVSNETSTYYFANNNIEHFSFNADERFLPIYTLADKDNKKITHLHEFSKCFLEKCCLGQLISQYMVLVASEQKLMIMRPYQIYAVKSIIGCITQNRGNGYIWHTTGSGKTLTSFKASTLLKANKDIEKCLFVVDRKDLDRQTRLEFNKFQEGCVEENTNTENLVKRLESDAYKDKVIVATIQKLGLALDEDSKYNKEKRRNGELTYKERLSKLRDKRIAIIFDECHRSQFGDYHNAIKDFFPKAQLFGFTGTPIFEENAIYKQIDGTVGSLVTTKDVFEKELHAYTITNAIDDRNVLPFNINYFKLEDEAKASKISIKKAIVKAILKKHDTATNHRRFNAIFATSSINDAIEYYDLFKALKDEYGSKYNSRYEPLNIACVFSPPADGNKDVQQLQEDLPQEQADNKKKPEEKKAALKRIIDDYNKQYNSSHDINEFDLYYQDVQKRIKDQQYSNQDYPHKNKIDITIVVDMLLTGFDSKYLNTLYVDKNLKQHGLIQAFSRTNRILNDTKPAGLIFDFKGLKNEVDEAITLFSGKANSKKAKEIWLVDPAPIVVKNLNKALNELELFMKSQGLECKPEEVYNLEGNIARCEFINKFKEIQRIKTQLDQYINIDEKQRLEINKLVPEEKMQAFRGVYLDVAQKIKSQQDKNYDELPDIVKEVDPEFVLFSSALIDYDYIMSLISQSTQSDDPKKEMMSREQLIQYLLSSSNMMDEREDIIEFIKSLETGKGMSEEEIKAGYRNFKEAKVNKDIFYVSQKHNIEIESLKLFIDEIIKLNRFDGEKLTDLITPLELSWREKTKKELSLMEDLIPLLKKMANGREIIGLNAYE